MKRKSRKLSEQALSKINRRSEEIGKIWDENDEKSDEFSRHSEDATHSNRQINKNLGEY